MVARAGGYFGVPFKGQHGVTKWQSIFPTISNMVVDAVLRHWVSVVAAMEGLVDPGTEGLVQDIQRMVVYFYTNDGPLT